MALPEQYREIIGAMHRLDLLRRISILGQRARHRAAPHANADAGIHFCASRLHTG